MCGADPKLPVDQKMANALRVLILDPKTQAYLMDNDPKALQQARDAVREYEAGRLCPNCGQDKLTSPQCYNLPPSMADLMTRPIRPNEVRE